MTAEPADSPDTDGDPRIGLERPYRLCLAHELHRGGLRVEAEKILPVVYDGLTIDLGYRIDLIVEEGVIVELKAVETLTPGARARERFG